jgi:hypothetical protein
MAGMKPLIDEELQQAANRFVETWVAVLTRIGGWSEKAARKWAAEHISSLVTNIWFLHDPPLYFLGRALAPEHMRRIPGTWSFRIERAILPPGPSDILHPDLEPDFDWEAARQRVQRVIEELEREFADARPK